jgi:hypothetical protein
LIIAGAGPAQPAASAGLADRREPALVGDMVRIGPDAVRVTTTDIDPERAVVEVATKVENDSTAIRRAVRPPSLGEAQRVTPDFLGNIPVTS